MPPLAPVINAVGMVNRIGLRGASPHRRMNPWHSTLHADPARARAAYLLRGNDLGVMTSAAPKLYPHMWSWDAAFVAVGLAPLSVERAVVELDTLLSAQWTNGMIPHIVFAPGSTATSGRAVGLPGAGRTRAAAPDRPPASPSRPSTPLRYNASWTGRG